MDRMEKFPGCAAPGVQHHEFSPYESNGGTIVAIAGDDYVVIAADTRLSSGHSIMSREQSKLFKLSPKIVLASAGCWADALAFTGLVRAHIQMYEHTHFKTMSTDAAAHMLSVLMYNKRFFPYFLSNVLAGLDNEGKGVVYSYDPIGHCERTRYTAGGSSGDLLQSVLDNQVGLKNMKLEDGVVPKIDKERAVCIATDAFTSAAERDIHTGDFVIINLITKTGIEERKVALRKD